MDFVIFILIFLKKNLFSLIYFLSFLKLVFDILVYLVNLIEIYKERKRYIDYIRNFDYILSLVWEVRKCFLGLQILAVFLQLGVCEGLEELGYFLVLGGQSIFMIFFFEGFDQFLGVDSLVIDFSKIFLCCLCFGLSEYLGFVGL